MFSNEPSDDSSNTSGNTIRTIINLIPSVRNLENNEKEQIVENLQPYARKLAHFTLYAIGGTIAILNFYIYNLSDGRKITYSILFGFVYAITDEIHQIFIPRKSRRSRRCNN